MGLIEHFGSYEKAKTKRDDINHTLENCEFLGGGDAREGLYERLESIENALLEYRRQHNIFEEKDNIVFVDEFMHGELMTVAWVRNGEVWMDDGAKRCTDLTMIRHATAAEIEAGHRLPEKDKDV
jgi:hypothetical protein